MVRLYLLICSVSGNFYIKDTIYGVTSQVCLACELLSRASWLYQVNSDAIHSGKVPAFSPRVCKKKNCLLNLFLK